MNDLDKTEMERKDGQNPSGAPEETSHSSDPHGESLREDFFSALFGDSAEKARESRHAAEILDQGYTQKAGKLIMRADFNPDRVGFGTEVAASLTDKNFENPLAHELWNMLPEQTRNSALIDFSCSMCLLADTLGLTAADVEGMTSRQFDAAMQEAMQMRRSRSPKMEGTSVTQIENIHIFFRPTQAPGNMDGKKALQIAGNCQRCGTEITRTLTGGHAQWVGAMGTMKEDAEKYKRQKTGRNDPCPCGSGLKYKKCCGKNA